MLKKEQILNHCMINAGKNQCRYLSKIENEETYCCLKKTKYKIIIDSVLKENKKNNKHPAGDNCPGIEQLT
jgi:hypothetical protein